MRLKLSILFIVSITISFIVSEFIFRSVALSDRFGWNLVIPLERRVQRFNHKKGKKIVCLGDSFIEWRAGSGINILDRVEKKFPDLAILNLGYACANIDHYIKIYKKYIRFQPDMVILFIYMGDDVRWYPSLSEIENSLESSESQEKKDIKLFLKKNSLLLNAIFRMLKIYIPSLRSKTFESWLKKFQKQENISDDFIRFREKQIDARILERAKGDAINPITVAMGLFFPDYYKDLFAGESGRIVADTTLSLIREFREKYNLELLTVVLIPESIQVSSKYDDFFKKCGFNLDNFPMSERRRLNVYLTEKLNAMGIKVLDLRFALEKEEDVYIKEDTHLNAKGHRIAAEEIINFIKFEFINSR